MWNARDVNDPAASELTPSGSEPSLPESERSLIANQKTVHDSGSEALLPQLPELDRGAVDERLYSAWLATISASSPGSDDGPDLAEVLRRRTGAAQTLLGRSDSSADSDFMSPIDGDPSPEITAVAGGAHRKHLLPTYSPLSNPADRTGMATARSSRPRHHELADDGKALRFRKLTAAAVVTVLTVLVVGYQFWLPRYEVRDYIGRMARAYTGMTKFADTLPWALGPELPPDLRPASREMKAALDGVAAFRRAIAENPPPRLPLVVVPTRPDPRVLVADLRRLADTAEPFIVELRGRHMLYSMLAELRDQVDSLQTLAASPYFEGRDIGLLLKSISSNLRAIQGVLTSIEPPQGCVALHGEALAWVDQARGTLESLTAASPPDPDHAAATLQRLVDRAQSALGHNPEKATLLDVEGFARDVRDTAARYGIAP